MTVYHPVAQPRPAAIGLLGAPVVAVLLATLLTSCGAASAITPASVPPGKSSPVAPVTAASASPSPRQSALPRVAVGDVSTAFVQPQPAPGTCHARGTSPFVLPDPRCTPGAVTAAITQANVTSTICTPKYADKVTPTGAVRRIEGDESRDAYGVPRRGEGFSYLYLVPLELGGSTNDPRNSWPESAPVAAVRAQLGRRLLGRVCDGSLPLVTAQSLMAIDWVSAYRSYIGPTENYRPTPAPKSSAVALGASCPLSGALAHDTAGEVVICSPVSGSLVWKVGG